MRSLPTTWEPSLFKTGITKGLFHNFLNSLELNKTISNSNPTYYVDPESGDIKLLTNLIEFGGINCKELHVCSIDENGEISIYSTEE